MNDLHDEYCNSILFFKKSVSEEMRKKVHNIVFKSTNKRIKICKELSLSPDYWNFTELDYTKSKSWSSLSDIWRGK